MRTCDFLPRLRRFFSGALACAFVSVCASLARAEIHIGVAVQKAGSFSSLSEQIITGARFAADEINASGGLLGESVAIDVVDDGCDGETAKNVANQLVGKGVVAVIGHLCDRASIEASGVYATNGIVQISPSAENPAFTENRPLPGGGTYRLAPRNTAQNERLLDFIRLAANGGKIAIVDDGSVYGKSLTEPLISGLKAAGLNPVLTASFESGEERYRSLSGRIVDSGARVVVIGATHRDIAVLVRDIDRLSAKPTIVGGDAMVHPEFPVLVLDGNAARTDLDRLYAAFPIDPRTLPSARDARAALSEKGLSAAGLTLRGHAAMTILADALKKAGKADFAALNQVLSTTTFTTTLGAVAFDAKGDATIPFYAMHKWQGETIVPINKVAPW